MLWKTVLTALFLVLAGCDRSQSASGLHAHSHGHIAMAQVAAGAPAAADGGAADAGSTELVCPMHPEVVSDKAGNCPKCNMPLEPRPAGRK